MASQSGWWVAQRQLPCYSTEYGGQQVQHLLSFHIGEDVGGTLFVPLPSFLHISLLPHWSVECICPELSGTLQQVAGQAHLASRTE